MKYTYLWYTSRVRMHAQLTRPNAAKLVWLVKGQSSQSFQAIALNLSRALRTNLPTHPSFKLLCCDRARSSPPSVVGVVELVAPRGWPSDGAEGSLSRRVIDGPVIPQGWLMVSPRPSARLGEHTGTAYSVIQPFICVCIHDSIHIGRWSWQQ